MQEGVPQRIATLDTAGPADIAFLANPRYRSQLASTRAGCVIVAPAHAERIDVGPAAPEQRDQDAICYLLVEKAREGKTVARLKWGDPFLFDRGGEEALFLHEQGVHFEVVPGVPVGRAGHFLPTEKLSSTAATASSATASGSGRSRS